MKRLMLFSLVLIISLVLAAVTPGLVYAEGDIPEAPPPEPVVEETAPEDAATAVEVLAEAGAVIADPGGEVVPLASQAALDVVCDPDPWFYCSVGCVGGKSPVYGTFFEALNNWTPKKGYGYLYVQGSVVPYNIGPNTIYGGGTGNPFSTMTGIVWDKTGIKPVINGTIELYGFTKGFTMQGLTITANSGDPAIDIHDTFGTIKLVDVSVINTGDTGIEIAVHKGPVIITNVNVKDSLLHGLYIDNKFSDGTKYVNVGNVTITNSSFIRNGGPGILGNHTGLTIFSSGSILLNGVTAFGNEGDGADLINYGVNPLVIRNSVFSNNQANPDASYYGFGIYTYNAVASLAAITLDNVILAGNEADGALLRTGGNIILNKVYATSNTQHGVYISGNYDADSVGAKNVIVTNSTFIGNTDNNLEIHASGGVKIANLYSTASVTGSGLFVNNNSYGTIRAPVSVLGAVLSKNSSSGGYIGSLGTITLAGISALANGSYGMYLDNQWLDVTSGIIVSGTLGMNRFNDNSGARGFSASTYGNASISSVQANGNNAGGVFVAGYGVNSNVSLVNVEASGNKNSAFVGVSVSTSGSVMLNKVTALMNAGQGINIYNAGAAYSRPVQIISSTASENGKEGIYVRSAGAITLSGVTASGNTYNGADLLNSLLSIPATQVPQGITVSRSTFDQNGDRGLTIDTLRKVTLTSINASENSSQGVYVTNFSSTVGSAIVVSGTNRFNHNGRSGPYHGILLDSKGPVTISGITAAWNTFDGLYVSTFASVTASNIQLIGNSYNGAEIYGSGLVTLAGITALQNGTSTNNSGVYISCGFGKVRINSGLILGNGAYGLRINVATPATDAYVAPGVVVFGNDVVAPYEGLQVYIH